MRKSRLYEGRSELASYLQRECRFTKGPNHRAYYITIFLMENLLLNQTTPEFPFT